MILVLAAGIALLDAMPCKAEVVVTSVWKRTAFTIANNTVGGHIKVQGDRIALTSWGFHGPSYSQYWYSTNDGLAWSGAFYVGPWFAFKRDSFFLGRDGNPFAIHASGHLYYSTNFGHNWLTNLYVPSDHSVSHAAAAIDPATNAHMFYIATNCPPLDPIPSTNIRYAVFIKKTAGPGWDLPTTNVILGEWPATNAYDHGVCVFRDPIAGRFRSARADPGSDWAGFGHGNDPYLCAVTNNGGTVSSMNTPWPRDGAALTVAVDTNGTVYMAHVGGCTASWSSKNGTNLLFSEFIYDETTGLSFVTNLLLATGVMVAPDYHYVSAPCIALGVNGEVIIAYLTGGDGDKMNDVRIMARDRFGQWHPPVTVASGDYDLGAPMPGAGTIGFYGRQWAGATRWGLAMDVVWEGDKNNVYLYYGEYQSSLASSGADTRNGVVHMLKVYDPPPSKGTRVLFR